MRSAWYVLGREVEAFEQEFAAYCGVKHCVGVGNGLEALHLILRAYGIGAGRRGHRSLQHLHRHLAGRVYAGATPVPVEPDRETFNIDPARIEAAITPRTKAIMPVHLYGQPADMDPIMSIARRARAESDRGQRAGAGRALQGPAHRFAGRRRGQQLLSRQKPRRVWRCRRRDDRTTRSWPTASGLCATTVPRRNITTTSRATTRGWTKCKPPFCG